MRKKKPPENSDLISHEAIARKILLIRDKKVVLDRDISVLYGVETRILNQAVKRNIERFPDDFMFQLTKEEMANWISQTVTSNKKKSSCIYPRGSCHVLKCFKQQKSYTVSS